MSRMRMMNLQENVPLSRHSTMRLGGSARYLVEIHSKEDLQEALKLAEEKSLPTIMIGDGSNIIWKDIGYPGLVLVNRLSNFVKKNVDEKTAEFVIGAGESWDEIVKKTVDLGYSGIEQLSLIPGTAGGTPVQNVGAYGREIKDVLVSVEAYDSEQKKFVTLSNKDCGFGYRTSRFKTKDKSRFFITSITLKLSKGAPKPPFYESLQKYFDAHDIQSFTPQIVCEAVIAVRKDKLPDPSGVANNGSFFANPIVEASAFAKLEIKYPQVVHWRLPNGKVKISAAWLVEQAGFAKDTHDPETGMATWRNHSLVLVNEKAKRTADLLKFRDRIIQTVHAKFDITLEQEPELI